MRKKTKYGSSRKKRILIYFFSILMILYVSLHFLSDKFVHSKTGVAWHIPEILSLTDFFISPIDGSEKESIRTVVLDNNFKIPSKHIFSIGKSPLACELEPDYTGNYLQPYFNVNFYLPDSYYNRSQKIRMYPFQKGYLAPFIGNYLKII